MKKAVAVSIAFTIIIGSAFVYLLSRSQVPSETPDISVSAIDGRKIHFKSMQGKPFLVTFWATTCSMCLKEMPHLVELYDELNKEGFEIVGIAMSYDPPNRVVALSEQKNIPYTIALDIDGSAAKAFGDVYTTPTSFLINANGQIIQHNTGVMNMNNLRLKIRELLATKETTFS